MSFNKSSITTTTIQDDETIIRNCRINLCNQIKYSGIKISSLSIESLRSLYPRRVPPTKLIKKETEEIKKVIHQHPEKKQITPVNPPILIKPILKKTTTTPTPTPTPPPPSPVIIKKENEESNNDSFIEPSSNQEGNLDIMNYFNEDIDDFNIINE
jgi:hypothetical protein